MPKKRESRIYSRRRGGETRYYGDFRDFADVGGKREALIPDGATTATTDPDVAAKLASDRLDELEAKRRGKDLGIETGKEATLKAFAAHHLREKARAGIVSVLGGGGLLVKALNIRQSVTEERLALVEEEAEQRERILNRHLTGLNRQVDVLTAAFEALTEIGGAGGGVRRRPLCGLQTS